MDIRTTFKNLSLTRFLEEIDCQNLFWITKRLSGNDTGLTGGHQAGPYLPRTFFETAIPEICTIEKYNPDALINGCYFPAQDFYASNLRAIYYNSKFFPEKGHKKKYDEFRITCWGGRSSPVQDIENTGGIFIFAIRRSNGILQSAAWISSSLEEENLIESWVGEEIEPGRFCMKRPALIKEKNDFCPPLEWIDKFPSGRELFEFVIKLLPRNQWEKSIDDLLLKRREIEFQIFQQIEQAAILPRIQRGFSTVEEFIGLAHSVSNRRKSRTGMSLELNLESIFTDEKLLFEIQVVTENRKKPDFIFPSGKAYHTPEFSNFKLHMLAAKTCCKDRWRQISTEADRISPKHLFTVTIHPPP